MAEFGIHDCVAAVPASDWNRCFPRFLERHDCLAAIETAGLDSFAFHAVTAWRERTLVACAPAFVTRYDLATTLGEAGRRIARDLGQVLPRLLSPRLTCLGSPCTEVAPIGFSPDLNAAQRTAAARALVAGLNMLARRERAQLVALKDVTSENAALMAPALGSRRYSRLPGLPVASLAIDFDDLDGYLASLSTGTRRDMRRKLRTASEVRVERTRNPGALLGRIMEMYEQTRARAEMAFETLTPAYFLNMLACDGAFLTLYWDGDTLVAANLLIEAEGTLLDKFFCMDAARGRRLNLYFLSWFENLDYCLANHLGRYQAGQAAYANKLRLGCTLQPTRMYFRHRNPILNRLLAFAAPRLAAEMPTAEAA